MKSDEKSDEKIDEKSDEKIDEKNDEKIDEKNDEKIDEIVDNVAKIEHLNLSQINKITNENNNNNNIPSLLKNIPKSAFFMKVQQIIEKEEEKYKIFIKDFKHHNLMTIKYVFFEMLKFSLYSLIIVIFYGRPLFQIVLFFFVTFYFICYLVYYRPFKSYINFFVLLAQDIILLYIYAFMIVFAYCDHMKIDDIELKIILGRYVMYGIWTLMGLLVCSLFEKTGKTFKDKIDKIMNRRKRKREKGIVYED